MKLFTRKREIADSVVIVTGASSGIGTAVARQLAARGARLVLAARRLERLERLAEEIRAAGGQALAVPTDVRDEQACRALVEQAHDQWGQIDVLINNAGLAHSAVAGALVVEQVLQQVEVNLLGAIWCANAVVPLMRRQGSGHIINVGSIASTIGIPTAGVYCATKFALDGLSQSLRAELRLFGIEVSLLCPGFVATEFGGGPGGAARERRVPGPLLMSPDYCASWIVRLIERPRRKVVISWPYHLVTGTSRFFPGLAGWAMGLGARVLLARRDDSVEHKQ